MNQNFRIAELLAFLPNDNLIKEIARHIPEAVTHKPEDKAQALPLHATLIGPLWKDDSQLDKLIGKLDDPKERLSKYVEVLGMGDGQHFSDGSILISEASSFINPEGGYAMLKVKLKGSLQSSIDAAIKVAFPVEKYPRLGLGLEELHITLARPTTAKAKDFDQRVDNLVDAVNSGKEFGFKALAYLENKATENFDTDFPFYTSIGHWGCPVLVAADPEDRLGIYQTNDYRDVKHRDMLKNSTSKLNAELPWLKDRVVEELGPIKQRLATRPKILFVGVGDGREIEYLEDEASGILDDCEVYGYDPDKQSIEDLQKKEFKFKVEFKTSSDLECFGEIKFDLIVASASLHYVPEKRDFFQSLNKVTGKGSVFIASVENPDYILSEEMYADFGEGKEERIKGRFVVGMGVEARIVGEAHHDDRLVIWRPWFNLERWMATYLIDLLLLEKMAEEEGWIGRGENLYIHPTKMGQVDSGMVAVTHAMPTFYGIRLTKE